jgi:hypothetical protein
MNLAGYQASLVPKLKLIALLSQSGTNLQVCQHDREAGAVSRRSMQINRKNSSWRCEHLVPACEPAIAAYIQAAERGPTAINRRPACPGSDLSLFGHLMCIVDFNPEI